MKWETAKLSSLCDLKNGKAYNADDWATEGLPIIRIQNLNDSSKGFNYWAGTSAKQIHVKPRDLLLAWSGTPGTSFGAHIWNGPEGVLNQHIFRVDIINRNIEKRWFQFCINQQINDLIHQAHGGVGLKHVTKGAVDALEIPLPPIAEQKRIVGILDSADALRAKRRESLAQLDSLLQSTFLNLFGDPVSNPMGWEVKKLKDLTTRILSGNTPKGGREVYTKTGITFFRSQNVWRNKIDLDDIAYIDDATHRMMSKSSLKNCDILITKTGRFNTENSSLGRAALFVGPDHSANINGHVYLVRLKEGLIHKFVLFILTSDEYREYIRRVCVGGIDKRQINKEHLNEFPIISPPLDLQRRFAAIVESVERQKARQRAHLAELDALFASLQHRAFRGEL